MPRPKTSKEKTHDYSKFWWIYCIYNVLNYGALWLLYFVIFYPNIIEIL
jgi:hypothetical protein